MRPQTFTVRATSIVNFLFELALSLVEDDRYAAQLQPVRVQRRR